MVLVLGDDATRIGHKVVIHPPCTGNYESGNPSRSRWPHPAGIRTALSNKICRATPVGMRMPRAQHEPTSCCRIDRQLPTNPSDKEELKKKQKLEIRTKLKHF